MRTAVFELLAQLLRRQFPFYVAIIALAVAGIVFANGWSWTSAIVIVIAAIVIPFAFILTAFWISVFSSMARPEEKR
jgi:hypothetical protein